MTPPSRAAIEERLRKATPGPWSAETSETGGYQIMAEGPQFTGRHGVVCSRSDWPHLAIESIANADLIAHAPTDIAFLLSEIDRLGKELEWQDISTAPKDGTIIDLCAGDERIPDAYWGRPHHTCGEAGSYCDHCPDRDDWCDVFGYVCGDEGRSLRQPTHWRPLPAPPATQLSATEDGEGK